MPLRDPESGDAQRCWKIECSFAMNYRLITRAGCASGLLLRGQAVQFPGLEIAWEPMEGEEEMLADRYRVIVDPQWGYRRLDPIPNEAELNQFYEEHYYQLVATGNRAPYERRLFLGGEEAEQELRWLSKTLWSDIKAMLEGVTSPSDRRLLDVGCGTGHFAAFMSSEGRWHVVGVDPAADVAEKAHELGVTVYRSLDSCARAEEPFGAATLIHVLEHIGDPVDFLGSVRERLSQSGHIVVVVPNDFSPLQEAARTSREADPWWIAIPDHVNYFSFGSLERVLESVGFKVVEVSTTFPMEFFLFWNENYVGHPDVGAACHRKRVMLELALPQALRREIYRSLAKVGVGRDCVVLAQRVG